MTRDDIFSRIKWLQGKYGTDLMLYFLAELITAHNDYNFEEMFKELADIIDKSTIIGGGENG